MTAASFTFGRDSGFSLAEVAIGHIPAVGFSRVKAFVGTRHNVFSGFMQAVEHADTDRRADGETLSFEDEFMFLNGDAEFFCGLATALPRCSEDDNEDLFSAITADDVRFA